MHLGFNAKLIETMEAVKSVLGLPCKKTRHKKFLVDTNKLDTVFQPPTKDEEASSEYHMSIFKGNTPFSNDGFESDP